MAVLGSTSLTGCNSIPAFIASGTLMMFQQSTAPSSWTKQTSHNDKSLRVVSGNAVNGGTNAFSNTMTNRAITGNTGNHTLTTAQMPSHTHLTARNLTGTGAGFPTGAGFLVNGNTGNTSSATGGGGSHSHPFSGNALDMRVQFVDVIIAAKDA